MSKKRIIYILITLAILFFGSILFTEISLADRGFIPLDTPHGFGVAVGFGLPTLLMITGIGMVVALVSKKPIAGVIAIFISSWFMGSGMAEYDGQHHLIAILLTGGVASLIILLWWGKLDGIITSNKKHSDNDEG